MIFWTVFFFILVIGVIILAITLSRRSGATPDQVPLGCTITGNKIQCKAFD